MNIKLIHKFTTFYDKSPVHNIKNIHESGLGGCETLHEIYELHSKSFLSNFWGAVQFRHSLCVLIWRVKEGLLAGDEFAAVLDVDSAGRCRGDFTAHYVVDWRVGRIGGLVDNDIFNSGVLPNGEELFPLVGGVASSQHKKGMAADISAGDREK